MTRTELALNAIEIIRGDLDDLGEWSAYNDDSILDEIGLIGKALNLAEQKVMGVFDREQEQQDIEEAQQRQSIYDYSEADGMAGEI